MNIDSFLSRLDQVKETGQGRWMACCPSHDDKSPSLSIKQLECGKILIHCFAGCGAFDVLDSINFSMSDLFADAWKPTKPPRWAALDATIVIIAKDNIRRGINLNDEDMKRYREASRRLYGS